jgi:hypothetical protein
MAQTKRKRRTKHRGNAAGSIEARGRTGRKPTDDERKGRDARGKAAPDRRFQRPTLRSAAVRAGLASLMLFVLFRIGLAGNEQSIATTLGLCFAAFAIYVPLGYKVDQVIWERRMRKAGRPVPPKKQR